MAIAYEEELDDVIVEGLFSSVTHAFSSVTHAVSSALNAPVNLIKRIPVVGTIVKATVELTNMPIDMLVQVAKGGRLDKVALGNFKRAIGDAKAVAPYAQMVVSMVPGIGTGLSGAIGGSLALASGHSITDAMAQAVQDAIPGGMAARAAFKVAHGVIQGKKIDAIALDAIPLPPAQKAALTRAVSAAKDLVSGKRVDSVIMNQVVQSLPPAIRAAVQTGVAVGQATLLQEHAGKAQAIQKAVVAADHVVAALKNPVHARQAAKVVNHLHALAKSGDPAAKSTAIVMLKRAAAHRVRNGLTVHPKTGRVYHLSTGKTLT